MTLVPWLLLVGIKPFTGLHGFVPGLGLQNRARRTIPIVPFGGSGVGCLRLGGPFSRVWVGAAIYDAGQQTVIGCQWASSVRYRSHKCSPKPKCETAKPGTPNLHNLQL